ncbi:MAG: TonB-dependent receptor [Pseudomonadales bacterium]|jgi:outer membrane receptor protein involved in Fe transport|nr:TonB-dependent receptor [Pseudomonadales bacterium]
MMKHARVTQLALTIATLVNSLPLIAQQNSGNIDEIVVFGRNTDLVGTAQAASEGSVGGADLLIRPLFKVADLLESMPGLVAVQHSGSGKANQYFLRGFNLDHGTDFTTLIDGMPWNLRSHGHGQGYLDINGLIPETVERIDYRKGPYRADLGDFAMVGASFIKTIDRLEQNFVSSEIGQYGWRRVAGGATEDLSPDSSVSFVGDYSQNDGPWQRPEGLRHVSLWSKYLQNTRFGQAMVSLSGYHATWDPTEQMPERAIGSTLCPDAYCSLDPSATGKTTRWILTSQLTGADWQATLYGQTYDWTMYSNPTYDYQIKQFDKRWTLGGSADKTLFDDSTLRLVAGLNFRYDDGSRIGVDHTEERAFVAPIIANAIKEGSLGAYLEATWYATDTLRVIGGARADYYNFKVAALNDQSADGSSSQSLASPKIGLAWNALDNIELYTNWGRGFHSNDARGVIGSIGSADPIPNMSPGTGKEIGARLTLGDFKFTSSYWWLKQDSELVFVGDDNSVEPRGASKRDGLELTGFWQPLKWLGIDAVYTHSKARYVNNPEGDHVEQAVETSAQLGISATYDKWDVSMRVRYLGPYALTPDNEYRSKSLTTLNLRGAWNFQHFTTYAEILNLLDTDRKEIVYYYPAYVAGFDPAGMSADDIDCDTINCTMSRAADPRSLRVGLSYRF